MAVIANIDRFKLIALLATWMSIGSSDLHSLESLNLATLNLRF